MAVASINPGGDIASSAWTISDADAARHPTLDTTFYSHHSERVSGAAKGRACQGQKAGLR